MIPNWEEFDLTDGINPTEFFILDEVFNWHEEEEEEVLNTVTNNDAGCLVVLLLLILPAVLMEIFK
jgi:hypothetical protein